MMCFVDVREEGDWGGGRVKAGEERNGRGEDWGHERGK